MNSFLRVVFVSAGLALLSACTVQLGAKSEQSNAIPVGTVKPEIDFSSESPGCELAGQRISENLQVGMVLADVRRLVGNPRIISPGRWIWTAGFVPDGRPTVRYEFGPADDDVPITSFSADTYAC